jgi:hypothetical protein
VAGDVRTAETSADEVVRMITGEAARGAASPREDARTTGVA